MGTVNTNEFRKKLKILIDDQPWIIVENDFVKPGKGQAFNRVKMKNMLTGRVIERNFKSGDTVDEAVVIYHQADYLYRNGDTCVFMDTETYEQIEVPADVIEEELQWLLENTHCEIAIWQGRVISVTPPNFMDLMVTYAEPGVRGDTATNVTKKAKLETGAEIEVPMFIDQGMKVRIDTRTGQYLERAK